MLDLAAPSSLVLVRAVVPGAPVAQGRGRAVRRGDGVRVIDPEKSASWKALASYYMGRAMRDAGIPAPFARALSVHVDAYFPRPKSLGDGPIAWRPSKPDVDNLAKACLDAGNGTVWLDDSQVVKVSAQKFYAASGTGPCVVIVVAAPGDAA